MYDLARCRAKIVRDSPRSNDLPDTAIHMVEQEDSVVFFLSFEWVSLPSVSSI